MAKSAKLSGTAVFLKLTPGIHESCIEDYAYHYYHYYAFMINNQQMWFIHIICTNNAYLIEQINKIETETENIACGYTKLCLCA